MSDARVPHGGKHPKSLDLSDHAFQSSYESLADESEPTPQSPSGGISDAKVQNVVYFGQILLTIVHFVFTMSIVGKIRPAIQILLLHGILSPISLILYGTASLSALYGFLAMYRKNDAIPQARKAQWFRRYMRMNKYFVLVWIVATMSMIFGCWEFNYVQTLPDVYSAEELSQSGKYEPIVRQLIITLPKLLTRLTLTTGITESTPPLDFLSQVGKFYYFSGSLATVCPAILLFVGIQCQRKYYARRFQD